MRLKKGKIERKLKKSLENVVNVFLIRSGLKIYLTQVRFTDIYEIIKKDPMKIGVPEIIGIQFDRYVIYPIPDKNYYVEIIGTVLIKL
jgi:hypothetical protein